ncbi:MAG TPA: TRAP transporter small permease subunit [Pseudorhodoplanes sp.]|nr:TRAP transporter small permease subunit [Pseudorhodoplanes sp.]
MIFSSLVINRHRHLKWRALDPLEGFLMALCGVSIAGFTFSVLCDVVTREIGYPWLWLQQVTTGFFGWGVFIGAAVATRRIDHLNLVEITKQMRGSNRTAIEVFNRLVVLVIGILMVIFGIQNAINDLGSFRMPSLIPLTYYTTSVPLCGALIVLFCVEQIANGWNNGFEGPEDQDDFGRIGSE